MNEQRINCQGEMTYGIYELTASFKSEMNGMIASWVSQISYDLTLLMAAVHVIRYTGRFIEKSGSFAVHVISPEHRDYMIGF